MFREEQKMEKNAVGVAPVAPSNDLAQRAAEIDQQLEQRLTDLGTENKKLQVTEAEIKNDGLKQRNEIASNKIQETQQQQQQAAVEARQQQIQEKMQQYQQMAQTQPTALQQTPQIQQPKIPQLNMTAGQVGQVAAQTPSTEKESVT